MNHREAFIQQLKSPYQSTIDFEKFLDKHVCLSNSGEILDIGTGYGGFLHYLKKKHSSLRLTGIDHDRKNIEFADAYARENQSNDIKFEYGDWLNMPSAYKDQFSGIVTIHTLCCFRNIEKPICKLAELNPDWIAMKSLFYEGPLDVLIHMRDLESDEIHDDNHDGDFNIFSINKTKEIFQSLGYSLIFEPFFPDIQMPRKNNGERGTYTVKTEWSDFTQFSGPVHLPWYFIIAIKNK